MPYFTTAELRTLPDMTLDPFTDARLVEAHDWVAAVIERECGTSFISTTRTETLTGTGSEALFLSDPYVQSVTALTVNGTVATGAELATVKIDHGVLYYSSGAAWSNATRGNITLTYVGGYSTTPPVDLKHAALRGARNWLLTTNAWSGVDTRATSITNEYGNISLAVASADGRPTGLPDVDATITAWAHRVRIPGVA